MDLFVRDWEDLRRLPGVLDETAAQAADITAHAVTWVARRDGFEPSPVCLLRPLAEAMDGVRAAFEAAGRTAVAELADLVQGVEAATRVIEASDAAVPACLPTVTAPDLPALPAPPDLPEVA
ncbi:hypothetical protein [Nocardioides marmotae]|uniref:hypothetical protein n=1 Tax=Nocardioides marmotae TaxID=2663857 RepID=UPI0012B52934|nr:hypothetical protein [Nocardioides marmotae]MBC9734887.1 hypothetical protein [Nocardioides marmotae]MTB85988.1 hypothetical protein [Nocardioides marmotae]